MFLDLIWWRRRHQNWQEWRGLWLNWLSMYPQIYPQIFLLPLLWVFFDLKMPAKTLA